MHALLLALLLAGGLQAAEHHISVGVEEGPNPRNLIVERGDAVQLINRSSAPVAATVMRFEPFPGCQRERLGVSWLDPVVIKPGESAKWCFNEAGTVPFYIRGAGESLADPDWIGEIFVGEKKSRH